MTKDEQRIKSKFAVATMEEHKRHKADEIIRKNILSIPEIKNSKNIFCFLSAQCEPDTISLVGELIKMGKNVSVPKCDDKNMDAIIVNENCDFKVGMYGIVEPVSTLKTEEIDTILTPLVAFDKHKNRLGHGKGYYDRFFAVHKKAKKIGVAYSCQEMENLSVEAHDKKLDMIVTENGVNK